MTDSALHLLKPGEVLDFNEETHIACVISETTFVTLMEALEDWIDSLLRWRDSVDSLEVAHWTAGHHIITHYLRLQIGLGFANKYDTWRDKAIVLAYEIEQGMKSHLGYSLHSFDQIHPLVFENFSYNEIDQTELSVKLERIKEHSNPDVLDISDMDINDWATQRGIQ